MSGAPRAWAPATILALGIVATLGADRQRAVPLRALLASAIPAELGELRGIDARLSEAERQAAGVTDYLVRRYVPVDGGADRLWLTLYVGYYDRQTQGRTIHSPRNCLPGAGWEALASERMTIATPDGPMRVNRYLLQRGHERALVLYWYQGRGRVEANEYVVKWDLLRDAALRGRTEEALVRILVPVSGSEAQALTLATRAAAELAPAVRQALPA